MRKRTKSRECALHLLYAYDIHKHNIEQIVENYWYSNPEQNDVKEFTDILINGVITNLAQIDHCIRKYADNWKIERMAVIDRNVMRIALYEILFMESVPVKVSINEAVDMAKKYGDADSGGFVNGVLDKINKTEVRDSKK
ncbi:MAG: transcription antitermination factor NusB [Candidatus Omnitrophota bacterium]|nr:MAG: transcription antitermination factor NusB [Candidatus Omnitrophota bacterium]